MSYQEVEVLKSMLRREDITPAERRAITSAIAETIAEPPHARSPHQDLLRYPD